MRLPLFLHKRRGKCCKLACGHLTTAYNLDVRPCAAIGDSVYEKDSPRQWYVFLAYEKGFLAIMVRFFSL